MGEPKVYKLGLLSLQFDSILVYVGLPLKWEVETSIYIKKGLKICDHMSQDACVCVFACVSGRVITPLVHVIMHWCA